MKTIPNFPNYSITLDGHVYSKKKGGFLTPIVDKNIYSKVALLHNAVRRDYYIHRLLAEAFIPNPENKPEVNHINGIRNDNRLENLEWCTVQENAAHRDNVLGKHKRGIMQPNHKLTEQQVKYVRSTSKNRKILAEELNVHFTTIYNILNNKTWIGV